MHILRHVLDDGDEKNRERPSSFLFAKERRDKERERKATFSLSRFPSAKIISKQNWILSLSRSCRDGWMHRKRARKRAISLISFRANAKVYARSDDDDDDDNSSSGGSTERERKKKLFLLTSRRIPKTLPSKRRCRQSNTSTIRCRRPVFYVRWLSSKRTSDTPPRRRMKLT